MLKSSREHVSDATVSAGISKPCATTDEETIVGDVLPEDPAPQLAVAVPHLARPIVSPIGASHL